MNHEDLRTLLRKQPFEPFRFYLTDGTTFYDVRHPEQCVVSRRTLGIAVSDNLAADVPDRVDLVAILHVARIEPLRPAGV